METIQDIIRQAGGYVSGFGVFIFDHWSGVAAFLLFATQLFINLRTIYKGRNK